MMDGVIEFRCETVTNSGNLTSEVINVDVEAQGMHIIVVMCLYYTILNSYYKTKV